VDVPKQIQMDEVERQMKVKTNHKAGGRAEIDPNG
jgi:hypothetical protein